MQMSRFDFQNLQLKFQNLQNGGASFKIYKTFSIIFKICIREAFGLLLFVKVCLTLQKANNKPN